MTRDAGHAFSFYDYCLCTWEAFVMASIDQNRYLGLAYSSTLRQVNAVVERRPEEYRGGSIGR
jgi:hypothetical protein